MQITGIIPARYQSTRFPGKPLADIKGKPMIQRTWEQARKALDKVVVATDDERIRRAVISFGGEVVMTSPLHRSGTDRCAEASAILASAGSIHDAVINIQGDEPFIQPEQIRLLADCFLDEGVRIATLVKKIMSGSDLFNPNMPKVVVSKEWNAIYFSRSPIPFVRGKEKDEWKDAHEFYRHIGMYGYLAETLREITRLEQSSLEITEMLEQNRWIENGYTIRVRETTLEVEAVDTPEDLARITGKD